MRLAFALLLVATVALAVTTLGALTHPTTYKIQSYNGTTWVDDVCYVNREGALLCTPSG